MKQEQLDEWWSGLTITQKERIAGKVVSEKAGRILTCFYPNCTNVWNTIPYEDKVRIHDHCTDSHGLILEEYQEKHAMSY